MLARSEVYIHILVNCIKGWRAMLRAVAISVLLILSNMNALGQVAKFDLRGVRLGMSAQEFPQEVQIQKGGYVGAETWNGATCLPPDEFNERPCMEVLFKKQRNNVPAYQILFKDVKLGEFSISPWESARKVLEARYGEATSWSTPLPSFLIWGTAFTAQALGPAGVIEGMTELSKYVNPVPPFLLNAEIGRNLYGAHYVFYATLLLVNTQTAISEQLRLKEAANERVQQQQRQELQNNRPTRF
jgi:hypothetical protein